MSVRIEMDEMIIDLAQKINKLLAFFGPWNFQLFKKDGKYLVHDINPRIANGIIFSMEAGAKFEQLIVDKLENVVRCDGQSYSLLDKSALDGKNILSFNECMLTGSTLKLN